MQKLLENVLSYSVCKMLNFNLLNRTFKQLAYDSYFIDHMTYIFSARAWHINPGLGEESTGSQHEDHVEHGMNRVLCHVGEGLRGRQVVTEASNGVRASGSATSYILLHSNKIIWNSLDILS